MSISRKYFTSTTNFPEREGKSYLRSGSPGGEVPNYLDDSSSESGVLQVHSHTLPLQHTLTCAVLQTFSLTIILSPVFCLILIWLFLVFLLKQLFLVVFHPKYQPNISNLEWWILPVFPLLKSDQCCSILLHLYYVHRASLKLCSVPVCKHACLTECMLEHPGWYDWIPGDLRVLYMEKKTGSPR